MKFTTAHLHWLYKQAKDERTRIVIKELEKRLGSAEYKSSLVHFDAPREYLRLGRWKIWLNKENPFYSIKAYTGIFYEKEHCRIPYFPARNDSIIFDIGANEGFYTLKAREIAPKAKIVAIEPNPSAFLILKKNIKTNNLKDIFAINKAVTSKIGKVEFEIVKGHTSVSGLKVYQKYRKKGQLYTIKVPSITLKAVCKLYGIRKIDLLKVDIEGSELEVLRSNEKTLAITKKVVVEYHKNRKYVEELMVKNGFAVVAMERKKYCGDIYFLRKVPIVP
jgi:FkbM family methyltransferase